MTLRILEKQPTQEKPYVVENYPYGFRLRTTIRYWVETTKRGQRFVSQTLNPKTSQWNKPKKSTYSQILLIGLDEKEHITYTSNSLYSTEETLRFKSRYEKYFSDYQRQEIANIIKMSEVYDKVEITIKVQKFRNIRTGEITEQIPLLNMRDYEEINNEGEIITPVDREKKDAKQKEINRKINSSAISNASKTTSVESALDTFKRI